MPFIKTKLLPKIIFSLFPFGYWEETDSYLYEDDDNYYCIGKNVITSITNDLAKQL